MANVYLRKRKVKNGSVWAVSVEVTDPRTGEKREQERGRFPLKRDAVSARARLLSEADAGILVEKSRRTVADLLDYWMQTEVVPNRRTSTAERHRYTVDGHLIPGLGGVDVQRLTAAQVQEFYASKRSTGTGASTLLKCHDCLHMALDMAVRLGWVGRNVTDAVTRPSYKPKTREIWSREQLSRFLSEAEASGYGPIWLMLAETGMRRGEALGLRWRDLALADGTLSIEQTRVSVSSGMETSDPKTDAGRRVIHLGEPFLIESLRRHRARQSERRLEMGPVWRDHDLVFGSEVGTPIQASNLWRHYKKIVERAGVPYITIHGIRHTVASLLIASGWDVTEVAYLLGHAKPSITSDIYSHVLPHRKKEIARDLGRLVMGGE